MVNRSNKCEKCGREFDSERGLHIHQTKAHGGEAIEGVETPESGLESSKVWAAVALAAVILVIVIGSLLLNYEKAPQESSEKAEEGGTSKPNVRTQSITVTILPENQTGNQTAT